MQEIGAFHWEPCGPEYRILFCLRQTANPLALLARPKPLPSCLTSINKGVKTGIAKKDRDSLDSATTQSVYDSLCTLRLTAFAIANRFMFH
jgi:hypothetical protein